MNFKQPFCAQETFWLKTVEIFLWIFFPRFFDIKLQFKRTTFIFLHGHFCQFNLSLLNKNIHFCQKRQFY